MYLICKSERSYRVSVNTSYRHVGNEVDIKEYKTYVPESVQQGATRKGKILTGLVRVDDKNKPCLVNGSLPGSYPGSYRQHNHSGRTDDIIYKTCGLPGSYPGSYHSQRQTSSHAPPKETIESLNHAKDTRKAENGKYMTFHELN